MDIQKMYLVEWEDPRAPFDAFGIIHKSWFTKKKNTVHYPVFMGNRANEEKEAASECAPDEERGKRRFVDKTLENQGYASFYSSKEQL